MDKYKKKFGTVKRTDNNLAFFFLVHSMEEEDIHIIKAKIVISLNALKDRPRENVEDGQSDLESAKISYGKISKESFFRKATVLDIFNGGSSPKSVTLISIIQGMGYTLSDFSAIYDSISDDEAKNYKLPRVKKVKKKES